MTNRVLYTIGSSDRSEEEFVDLLKEHDITLLVDVRSKNGSRVLHFDESRFSNLSAMLERHRITYDDSLHTELGGLQGGKMTLGNFRRYTQTPAFSEALSRLKERAQQNGHTVILCCERDPKQCHRRIIGDCLKEDGWQVVHLV